MFSSFYDLFYSPLTQVGLILYLLFFISHPGRFYLLLILWPLFFSPHPGRFYLCSFYCLFFSFFFPRPGRFPLLLILWPLFFLWTTSSSCSHWSTLWLRLLYSISTSPPPYLQKDKSCDLFSLQHLYLSSSSIPSLGPGDLPALPHLTSLSLANTGLTNILPGAFNQVAFPSCSLISTVGKKRDPRIRDPWPFWPKFGNFRQNLEVLGKISPPC